MIYDGADTIVSLKPLVLLFFSAWDAVELTLDVEFIYPFVVIHPTDYGSTTVVAPGRILDNFLPIPDAESLPFTAWYLAGLCYFQVTGRGGKLLEVRTMMMHGTISRNFDYWSRMFCVSHLQVCQGPNRS
jgi:hypothetical protein